MFKGVWNPKGERKRQRTIGTCSEQRSFKVYNDGGIECLSSQHLVVLFSIENVLWKFWDHWKFSGSNFEFKFSELQKLVKKFFSKKLSSVSIYHRRVNSWEEKISLRFPRTHSTFPRADFSCRKLHNFIFIKTLPKSQEFFMKNSRKLHKTSQRKLL